MAETPKNFESRVAAFIEAASLLVDGSIVVVGVSGGADSVALARALCAMERYRLKFLHVHHGLRGGDADGDAEFARQLASQLDVEFALKRIDVAELSQRWGVGTEEAARRARYEAFTSAAAEFAANAVAVAHHSGDQVETVLHRIIRGTHLRGLAGMAPCRALADGVDLVRPLLWARRDEIEAYCRQIGQPWRTDHTNAQNNFTRNFIRNELLPLVRERINPQADGALLRLSAAAAQAEDTMGALAGALFERACRKRRPGRVVLRVGALKKAPPALAAMAFRLALGRLGAPEKELTQQRYDDLLALVSGQAVAVDLPGGVRADRQGQSIALTRSRSSG